MLKKTISRKLSQIEKKMKQEGVPINPDISDQIKTRSKTKQFVVVPSNTDIKDQAITNQIKTRSKTRPPKIEIPKEKA